MENVKIIKPEEWKRYSEEKNSTLNPNRTLTETVIGTFKDVDGQEKYITEFIYTDLIGSIRSNNLRVVMTPEYKPGVLIYMGSVLIEHNDTMPELVKAIAAGLENVDKQLFDDGMQEISDGIAFAKPFGVKANLLKYTVLNAAGITKDCPVQLIYAVNELEQMKKMYDSKHPSIENNLANVNLTDFLPELLKVDRELIDVTEFKNQYPQFANDDFAILKEEVLLMLIKQKLGK